MIAEASGRSVRLLIAGGTIAMSGSPGASVARGHRGAASSGCRARRAGGAPGRPERPLLAGGRHVALPACGRYCVRGNGRGHHARHRPVGGGRVSCDLIHDADAPIAFSQTAATASVAESAHLGTTRSSGADPATSLPLRAKCSGDPLHQAWRLLLGRGRSDDAPARTAVSRHRAAVRRAMCVATTGPRWGREPTPSRL
jgi:hypothetical protein